MDAGNKPEKIAVILEKFLKLSLYEQNQGLFCFYQSSKVLYAL